MWEQIRKKRFYFAPTGYTSRRAYVHGELGSLLFYAHHKGSHLNETIFRLFFNLIQAHQIYTTVY